MGLEAAPAPSLLDFDEYADGIADASVVLRDNAARTGLDAGVPSCPGWTVRDLVGHLGVVHRWATATLVGDRLDTASVEQEAAGEVDLLGWFDDGVQDLLRTLDRSPEDLDAWFFLADAPPARLAWARRQCHETTVHAVDLMTASLGHPPTARQLWFGPPRAADGIDELLTGFLPRPQTSFRPGSGTHVVAVVPSDSDRRWTVTFAPEAIATSRLDDGATPTTTLAGSAVDLYLTLWNRAGAGQDVQEHGEPFLEQWRTGMKVTWR